MIINYGNRQIGEFTPSGIWTPARMGATAIWTPALLPDQLLYLEGDSKTNSGSTLNSAVDKSGAARNYTAHNMTWGTDAACNNKPVFLFNGSTGYLDRSATQFHPNYGAAVTHIQFFKPNNLPSSGDFRILDSFNTDLVLLNQGYFNYISANIPGVGIQYPMASGYANSLNTCSNTALSTAYQLWICAFQGGSVTDPTKFKYWFNGTPVTVTTRSAGTGNSTVNEIGRYPGGLFYLNASYGFKIVMSSFISDPNAALTWGYCQQWYGQ